MTSAKKQAALFFTLHLLLTPAAWTPAHQTAPGHDAAAALTVSTGADHSDPDGKHGSHDAAANSRDPRQIGATVYNHMCFFCHGLDGNGGGKATSYLFPWPRDFRQGIFKYKTTAPGSLPLDDDIYRVISRGIPGTAMPSWEASLTPEEIRGAVAHIKTFSPRFTAEKPQAPLAIGAPPPMTQELAAQGAALYVKLECGKCHGTDLMGGGLAADQLHDIWGHKSFVYDLTNPNAYKFGFAEKEIFNTLSTGIEGTPMQTYAQLPEEQRWQLVAFIRSRIHTEKYQPARYESDLRVQRAAGNIGMEPDNTVWNGIPAQEVHLLPLNARHNPVNRVKFQGIYNDEGIAFRLEWDDPSAERSSSRHQDFKDAVAMEFALGGAVLHEHGHNEPFFGMGNRGKVVNIWQWRADWQLDIETREKLENVTKGLNSDTPVFGGEVHPVDANTPFRETPVEELNAEGFGTLTPQPHTKQNVMGKGLWQNGKWTVVFYRPLESLNKWDVKFAKDTPILVSFAVWDGAYRDIDGRKMVAMWQRLTLQ